MDKLKMHTPNRADDNLEKSACPRQKKYKLYKSSINKSLHFVQRSLSSSTRG